jgi:hypothetical protein
MKRLKVAAKLLAVNGLILFVGLLILEAIFGNWFSPERMNRLNVRRNFETEFDISPVYPSATGRSRYVRDQYGFRGRYPSPDSIDILTIGGSTTEQRLLSEGETWQDCLARQFERHGKRVSVVNAGIEGQSTFGNIRNFDWWFPFVPNLRPRFVLAYVGINDVFRMDDSIPLDDLYAAEPAWRRFIKERSGLYSLYQKVIGAWAVARVENLDRERVDFQSIQWVDQPLLKDHAVIMERPLRSYEERLTLLLQKIKDFGATPICVTQTTLKWKFEGGKLVGIPPYPTILGTEINGVDFYYMLGLLNARTLQVCAREGGIPVDLAGELVLEEQDMYDFMHTTPRGAEKIGRYLYSKLSSYF